MHTIYIYIHTCIHTYIRMIHAYIHNKICIYIYIYLPFVQADHRAQPVLRPVTSPRRRRHCQVMRL